MLGAWLWWPMTDACPVLCLHSKFKWNINTWGSDVAFLRIARVMKGWGFVDCAESNAIYESDIFIHSNELNGAIPQPGVPLVLVVGSLGQSSSAAEQMLKQHSTVERARCVCLSNQAMLKPLRLGCQNLNKCLPELVQPLFQGTQLQMKAQVAMTASCPDIAWC
eukprot:3973781-Amphidinium_carterae.1